MAVLPLVDRRDPVLREKARRVSSFGPSLQRLIDNMFETMRHEHGVGLAANQVGSHLRIAVIGIPRQEEGEEDTTDTYVLINPEIVRRSGEREVDEGCLSIPGFRGKLQRSVKVVAKAQDRAGREYRLHAEGLLAQALEHETDHLNGTLYIDRMEAVEALRSPVLAGPEGQTPAAPHGTPDTETVWRMRRPAPPVIRRR
ncbi:MAG: peptide deformylase [Chloroflexi bacterium]|nr:peptide deformylase [Chloroflexota bacterium]